MKNNVWLVMVFWLIGGCSAEPVLSRRGLPIVGGTLDRNPAHQAVVAIMDNYGLCTATVISPDVLLTAAHCAQSPARDYTVFFGSYVYGATRRAVGEVRPHPDYDDQELKNDIALMRLSSPAPATVTPIPFLPKFLAISPLDIGTPLEFVGFGEDENGNAGTKLTVKNGLNWICAGDTACTVGPGYYAAPHNICQDQSPGGPCAGDSGGPAFILRDGREFVAGVTSFGDQDCRYYGCSTKVDEFESFILEWVGRGLGSPCYDDAQCDSGFCEQGFCCQSRCRGECLACNVGGQWGSCVVAPDGTPCPDGDACNGLELCFAGNCQAATPPDCDDRSPCTQDSCDPEKGCLHIAVSDGTDCADANHCDGEEYCRAGQCVEGPVPNCDDRNPCTLDGCLPDSGCIYNPVADGTDCSGGLCPQAACSGGLCIPTDPAACDDQNPCTRDACNPELGCVWVQMAEGSSCGNCSECRAGECRKVDCPGCGCRQGGGREEAGGAALLLALLLLCLRKGTLR